MHLLDLPEEVLIKIVRTLDTKSLYNIHSTCSHLRKIVGMPGVIKVCNLSLSSMASAHNLRFQFMRDLENHLQELNMSCVPNMNITLLLNTLMTMKVLKVLDVTYTTINILDLIEIHLICPTINDIGINFDFGIRPWIKIPPEILEECKTVFISFKKVHFVGNFDSLYWSNLPVLLLQEAQLSKLQLTITRCNLPSYGSSQYDASMGKFDHIIVYFLNWIPHEIYPDIDDFYLATKLNYSNCECIWMICMQPIRFIVYASPIFYNFFKENFGMVPKCLDKDDLTVPSEGNVIFMVWNKETTVFDDTFYESLFEHLQTYFPDCIDTVYNTSAVTKKLERLSINHICRTGLCEHTLDRTLDLDATGTDPLNFTICYPNNKRICISLSDDMNYLHKITHINLDGVLCCDEDFFSVLFKNCIRLNTTNFEFEQNSTAILCNLCEALPISKSLKNLRIVYPYLEMQSTLTTMSKCKNLQNIQIVDLCGAPQSLCISRAIFKNCDSLYSYVITMEMPPDTRARNLKILNKYKWEYKRYHLHIELHSHTFSEYSYDPFIGVFDIFPIKPL